MTADPMRLGMDQIMMDCIDSVGIRGGCQIGQPGEAEAGCQGIGYVEDARVSNLERFITGESNHPPRDTG